MNCATAELGFSGHYDGSLSPAERTELERHLAQCAKCAADFAAYVRAVARLKELRPGRASGVYVESILARVERSAPEFVATPVGRRVTLVRVASHFLAASVGAAAAFLLLTNMGREESPSRIVRPHEAALETPTVRTIPVRFVGDDRSIERNDRVEEGTESLTLSQGERLRALPSQRLELSINEKGELVVRAERIEVPQPVVQQTVNEIKFVDLPPLVNVDEAFVRTAVDTFETEVGKRLTKLRADTSMDNLWARLAKYEPTPRTAVPSVPPTQDPAPIEAAPEQSTSNHDPNPSSLGDATPTLPPALAPEHHVGSETTAGSPVVIRRDGTRTSLSIDGPITVVIPELIDLLADSNEDVSDLAATRLADIRTELEADRELSTRLKPFPKEIEDAPTEPHGVFGSLLHLPAFIQYNSPRPVPLSERWRRWWQDNALAIATVGSRDA